MGPHLSRGTPETAPAEALRKFEKKYEPIVSAKEKEAIRYAANDARRHAR